MSCDGALGNMRVDWNGASDPGCSKTSSQPIIEMRKTGFIPLLAGKSDLCRDKKLGAKHGETVTPEVVGR